MLRHAHYKLAKQAMGEFGKPRLNGQGTEETLVEFLYRQKIVSAESLMASRKAVWLGHAKRNKDEMMLEAFERDNNNESWWATIVAELEKFGATPDWVFSNADNRALIRAKFRTAADPTVDE